MNKKEKLNKLVVATLEKTPWNPTARQIFREIKDEQPGLVRKGFRSFVEVMNAFNDVQSVVVEKGEGRVYKVCRNKPV